MLLWFIECKPDTSDYRPNYPIQKNRCFQPNFHIFFTLFFTNSENATKSKFRQETLNILSVLKFKGSHLACYK